MNKVLFLKTFLCSFSPEGRKKWGQYEYWPILIWRTSMVPGLRNPGRRTEILVFTPSRVFRAETPPLVETPPPLLRDQPNLRFGIWGSLDIWGGVWGILRVFGHLRGCLGYFEGVWTSERVFGGTLRVFGSSEGRFGLFWMPFGVKIFACGAQ